jgi:hypothetical protein
MLQDDTRSLQCQESNGRYMFRDWIFILAMFLRFESEIYVRISYYQYCNNISNTRLCFVCELAKESTVI